MADIVTGKVIKIIDEYRVVINRGSAHGVSKDDRFLVYYLGPELTDPDTNEKLGVLELVCGEGKPEHIQEKMTTLRTAKTQVKKTRTVVKHNALSAYWGNTEETYDPEVYEIPFENLNADCIVRQIK